MSDSVEAPALRSVDLSLGHGGLRVIDGVSFEVAPGRTLAVMGPTGAGKSTLLAAFGAPEEITLRGGRAEVTGIRVPSRGRRRRLRTARTGYLAQGASSTLDSRLTVAETITEPITSRHRRVNTRALDARVAALLDEMALPLGAATKYPYELSAGMRQRVALARALVLDPMVFVGDDPFANLDVAARRAALAALSRRQDKDDLAILIATNDPATVAEMGAASLVLRGGVPVAFAPADGELIRTPDA